MTRPKHLSDLSPGMQRGLIRCHTLVVEVDDERHCGIAPRTLAALLRRGLIEAATDARLRKVYRPTPAGWELLRADEPLWMHKRSQRGYTRVAGRAVLDAGEVVPPAVLEDYAKQARERDAARLAGVDDELLEERRDLERRLSRLRQLALARGVTARDDLRVAGQALDRARRRLDAVEERIRSQSRNRAA